LKRGVVEGVLGGLLGGFVEVDGLDAAVVVADVECAVDGIEGDADGAGGEEECAEDAAGAVVPGDGGGVLRRRDGDVVAAGAVTDSEGGDGGAVVGECAEGTVGGLSIPAGGRFREGEKINERPDENTAVGRS
jgi:hypothetical protein